MDNDVIKEERIAICIDGSNFYHILKDLYKGTVNMNKFDFPGFLKFLVGNKKLIRTYYYSAPLDRKLDEEIYAKQ